MTTLLYRNGPHWLRRRSWRWRNSVAVMVSGIRGVVTLVAMLLIKLIFGVRVSEQAEREGLDISTHGERAYN